MTIKNHINDGTGCGYSAKVDSSNRLHVDAAINSSAVIHLPPKGQPNSYRYYTELLDANGDGTGNASMNVDGSVTPVEFLTSAQQDSDIRVMSIVITVVDGAISHSKFGALPALTNGFDLFAYEGGIPTYLIQGAKSGGQLIAQGGVSNPFGNTTAVNIIPNYSGNNDALFVEIPIHLYIPGGLRIGYGGLDNLRAVVNDDLTGLVDLTVRLHGHRHVPVEGI